MEGDGRGKGRVLVHLGGIRDLLLRVRRVPGVPNTVNRVPELPKAQERIAMLKTEGPARRN